MGEWVYFINSNLDVKGKLIFKKLFKVKIAN